MLLHYNTTISAIEYRSYLLYVYIIYIYEFKIYFTSCEIYSKNVGNN